MSTESPITHTKQEEAETRAEVSRRDFLKLAGAGMLYVLLSSGKTAQAEELIQKTVMPAQEKKDMKEPKINIRIWYGSHETKEDALLFSEEFKKANVFIPEAMAWTPEALDAFRKVSNGEMLPEECISLFGNTISDFTKQEIQMLYKSGKFVTFVDVPDGHPIVERDRALRFPQIYFKKDFQDVVQSFKDYYAQDAGLIKERETFIVERLKEFIALLKQEGESGDANRRILPKDTQKNQTNILIFLGAAHTGVFHYTKRDRIDQSSRSFASMPYLFPIEGEIYRRYLFGKEVPDTIIAQKIFEFFLMRFIFNALYKLSGNKKDKVYNFSRGMAGNFSFDEIKKMYEDVKESGFSSQASLDAHLTAVLNAALTKKGIRLPKSPEEFAAMLPPYARKEKPNDKTK